MTEKLNIYQRLNKIREAVDYLKKDTKVLNYKAVTHDKVTSELRPYLIKYGVMVVPRQISGAIEDTGKATQSGTPTTRYVAFYEIDFVNIDEPKDKCTVAIGSIAEDNNDKGPGKAVSYATKCAFLKLFSIETGEDDESRQEQKPTPITDAQLITLREICDSKNFPADRTLKKLAGKWGKKKIDEISQKDFDAVSVFLNEQPANEDLPKKDK